MCVPSGDHDGSNSGHGERVSRVRSVPSAWMTHTSSWLSNTIRPESEESEIAPPPPLGPEVTVSEAAGDGLACDRLFSVSPWHPPTKRAVTKEIVSRQLGLMTPLPLYRLSGSHGPLWSSLGQDRVAL